MTSERLRWWQFIERHRCPHPQRRCIHGDEINFVGGARSQCLRCGGYLPELPPVCTSTGTLHAFAEASNRPSPAVHNQDLSAP